MQMKENLKTQQYYFSSEANPGKNNKKWGKHYLRKMETKFSLTLSSSLVFSRHIRRNLKWNRQKPLTLFAVTLKLKMSSETLAEIFTKNRWLYICAPVDGSKKQSYKENKRTKYKSMTRVLVRKRWDSRINEKEYVIRVCKRLTTSANDPHTRHKTISKGA